MVSEAHIDDMRFNPVFSRYLPKSMRKDEEEKGGRNEGAKKQEE